MAVDIFDGISPVQGQLQSGLQQSSSRISSLLNAPGVDPNAVSSSIRSADIPTGAEVEYTADPESAQFSVPAERKDWRIKLSAKSIFDLNSPVLKPIQETNGMIFPYLPYIVMSHSANYQQMDIVHNNFPFYAYKNSQVDEISITGKFTVQNAEEGLYWLASVHFLRVVTKMYFGKGANIGNPPPICTLNGYGDFVYNNVSCIVKNFTVNMADDVDYIAVTLPAAISDSSGPFPSPGNNITYVPVLSNITVVVQPVYSREKIKKFDLNEFSKGVLIMGQDGKGFL